MTDGDWGDYYPPPNPEQIVEDVVTDNDDDGEIRLGAGGTVRKAVRSFKCPHCTGEFDRWRSVKRRGGKAQVCPFCGMERGQYGAKPVTGRQRSPNPGNHSPMDRGGMARGPGGENVAESKRTNDDWEAEKRLWGETFVLTLTTVGNELHGEIAHVRGVRAMKEYVASSESAFEPGDSPDSAEEVDADQGSVAHWERDNTEMELLCETVDDSGVWDESWSELKEAVDEVLPEGWGRQ